MSNRITWTAKGNAEIDSIIDQEKYVMFHAPRKGPRNISYGSWTEIAPYFRQERGEHLALLLSERGQLERLPGVLERLSAKTESDNLRIAGRFHQQLEIPDFNPEAIVAKAMAEK